MQVYADNAATTKMSKVAIAAMMEYLEQEPELLKKLVTLAMQSYYDICEKLQMQQQRDAVSALARFFLARAEGVQQEHILPKRYTENTISKLLGVHPITTAKIIKKLKEEDVISRGSTGWIIKNEFLLQEYANGDRKMSYRYQNPKE